MHQVSPLRNGEVTDSRGIHARIMGTEQVPVAGSHDPLRRSRLKHLQEQLRSLPICALPLHEAAGQQNNWPTFIADNETANRCPTVLSNWLPAATDFLLHGEIIGSIVRSGARTDQVMWTAELLNDPAPGQGPLPFTRVEHTFKTLEDVCTWLGGPEIKPLRRTE